MSSTDTLIISYFRRVVHSIPVTFSNFFQLSREVFRAGINANTTAQTQKILDAICGNRMADMQNQINQLQLQSALCGVVRWPNSVAFSAGNPFFSVLSFLLGVENLQENRQQSAQNDVTAANDKQAKQILDELGRKFEEQNEMLRRILEVITSEKPA